MFIYSATQYSASDQFHLLIEVICNSLTYSDKLTAEYIFPEMSNY